MMAYAVLIVFFALITFLAAREVLMFVAWVRNVRRARELFHSHIRSQYRR